MVSMSDLIFLKIDIIFSSQQQEISFKRFLKIFYACLIRFL